MTKHERLCDYCQEVVAVRRLRWHTIRSYVRLRMDEPPPFGDVEHATIKTRRHLCKDCFNTIRRNFTSKAKLDECQMVIFELRETISGLEKKVNTYKELSRLLEDDYIARTTKGTEE